MKRFFRGILILTTFLLLWAAWTDSLNANSKRAPISGTPMLREQKLKLLRDYEQAARIQTEIEMGRILAANEVGNQLAFWVWDFATEVWYQTMATCKKSALLSSGYYLHIYVEDTQSLLDSVLENIKNEFIEKILPTETKYFGSPPSGDFTILILEIRDNYPTANVYVSGYFDPVNEYPKSTDPNERTFYSNGTSQSGRHMIYMDCNPGNPGSTGFYGTLAHEFQHFIHYNYDPGEYTWVEEGLSGLARFVCGYNHQRSHIEAFSQTPTTSLTFWEDNLENYGATYLFMLYLAEHYGGATTIKNIVANKGRGITGINNGLALSGYSVRFNDIFKNWVIANYLNNTSISGGIYGYAASFSEISPAPGSIEVTESHSSYPAVGSGWVYPYAANYVKFSSLGGTYDIFVLIPYSLSEGYIQSYAYTARLGSLLLNLEEISGTLGMSGVKEGSSNPSPEVVSDLSSFNTISTSSGGGGSDGGGGGGCFIATAALGSSSENDIFILQEFRDRYLLPNFPGRVAVALYYAASPPLAEYISRHESLKTLTRVALYPLIGWAHWALEDPRGAGIGGLSLILLFGLVVLLKRYRRPETLGYWGNRKKKTGESKKHRGV